MLIKPKKKFWMTGIAPYYKAAGGGGAATLVGLAAFSTVSGYVSQFPKALNGGSTLPACCVLIGVVTTDGVDPTGPTIGGISMGAPVASIAGQINIYAADVTAGTNDSFTITNGTAFSKIYFASCYVTGLTKSQISATTANQTFAPGTSDPQHVSGTGLAVPSGGFGIGFLGATANAGTTPTGFNWSSSTSIAVSAGDSGSTTSTTGAASLAHTVTPGAGWIASVAGVGGNFNFNAAMLAITIG